VVRLDLQRVREAVTLIDRVFLDSPQYESGPLSEALGCLLMMKVETLNPVRSFNGRGTETVLSSLTRDRLYSSVVCASANPLCVKGGFPRSVGRVAAGGATGAGRRAAVSRGVRCRREAAGR